ncbi:EamA family transporter [Aeromicrobium camelliae]|uniref:EamA family transporter n=1 Tax=Aeromicrobium camelliae TaxID=1538144 RepID=UPI001FB665CC|nr:EamA family transporter [Aeromicrobium camelliae]
MPVKDRLLAVIVAVLWGLNFVVIDEGMDGVPPLLFLAIRFVFVAFPLILLVPRPKASWRAVVAVGAFMSLGQFSLLYIGLATGMPAGLASLVLQAQVIFTIVLAWVALGERTTGRQLVGVVVGTAGLALVALAHGLRAPVLPLLATVGAAASWAIGNVVARQAKVASGLSLVVWSALVVPVPCLLLALLLEGPDGVRAGLAAFGWAAAASTAYTAIGASLIGYTLFNGLLSRHPAGSVVPFILLVPPVGIASAWVFQGEVPTALEWAGAVVMMVGVAIASLSGRRKVAPAPEASLTDEAPGKPS